MATISSVMDVAVVLNPGSGAATDDTVSRRVVELLAGHGLQAAIFAAGPGAPIGDQARAAARAGCRVLAAAGGDGTVNAVATVAIERDIPLGILPMGTLNHFAKDLGLPLDLEGAVRVIAQGAVRRVDVAEVNGRIFLNNSSIGVYPRIVELRNRYGGRGPAKWIAALWATLAVLRRRPFLGVRIRTDEETVLRSTPFVFVGNNEYRMAGLAAASRESLEGGVLAVYFMHPSRRRSLLRLGWEVVWRGVDRVQELELFRVAAVSVETRRPRLQVALDGELATLASPLEYRSRPGALKVLAP